MKGSYDRDSNPINRFETVHDNLELGVLVIQILNFNKFLQKWRVILNSTKVSANNRKYIDIYCFKITFMYISGKSKLFLFLTKLENFGVSQASVCFALIF